MNIEAKTDSEQNVIELLQLADYYRQLDQPKNSLIFIEKVLKKDSENKRAMRLRDELENR